LTIKAVYVPYYSPSWVKSCQHSPLRAVTHLHHDPPCANHLHHPSSPTIPGRIEVAKLSIRNASLRLKSLDYAKGNMNLRLRVHGGPSCLPYMPVQRRRDLDVDILYGDLTGVGDPCFNAATEGSNVGWLIATYRHRSKRRPPLPSVPVPLEGLFAADSATRRLPSQRWRYTHLETFPSLFHPLPITIPLPKTRLGAGADTTPTMSTIAGITLCESPMSYCPNF
jgi:hypothetical protein